MSQRRRRRDNESPCVRVVHIFVVVTVDFVLIPFLCLPRTQASGQVPATPIPRRQPKVLRDGHAISAADYRAGTRVVVPVGA